MAQYIKLYFAVLIALVALDMIWLGIVARSFYQKYLGFLFGPTNWVPAVVFYLLFTMGIVVFVLVPGLQADSLRTTMLRAALFGLVTYATYDLTNLATVRDWPLLVTVVDLAWGTAVSVMVSCLGFWAGRWLS
jgi:uncharacterized membrane protein